MSHFAKYRNYTPDWAVTQARKTVIMALEKRKLQLKDPQAIKWHDSIIAALKDDELKFTLEERVEPHVTLSEPLRKGK
jgi:hypothetical protein